MHVAALWRMEVKAVDVVILKFLVNGKMAARIVLAVT